ncbi:hypothetical protein BDN71DRAFT_518554 [Pleurotus eryngii]|uniref:Uncharacterized protein n=1 Tax=Pleurotus eryngii TaxID=5323 RepID=A0A9P5ZL14_PLEER|nr:hypothetical protein BDN71DRAFT_518554 [Pleurotus eryngii]
MTSVSTSLASKHQHVGAMLLSTQPSPKTLAPTHEITQSAHTVIKKLARPFTELVLVIFPSPLPQNDLPTLHLSQIRTVGVACHLGRPMWLAQLLFNLSVMFPSQFAPIACRVFVHCGRELTQKLVESHLAFAFFVDEIRTNFEMGYPPEPFVSATVARITAEDIRESSRASQDTSPDAMVIDSSSKIPPSWLGVIDKAVADKQISRADRGELVSGIAYIPAR